MRVFEEAEREFKLFGRALLREGVRLQLLDDDQLLPLQVGDAPFIGGDDGRRGGLHDAVKHLFDLLLGLAEVIAQSLGDLLSAAGPLLPCKEEQAFEQDSRFR